MRGSAGHGYPAIRVQGLGKSYRIGHLERADTLRDAVQNFVMAPRTRLRKFFAKPTDQQTIWALRDVSFDLDHGQVLGIVGRNWAGKSTLLKILSRITHPTEGYADVWGRLASLLEIGTGFHQDLTGRDNVYLNGAILGMRRTEISSKFDQIVDFAGIEKFIDTPVKRYSSGMYVRLAFAVAAHLDPDILIVDEVLSVGDAEFQRKCLGKMGEVTSEEGRTVLFVSHNMTAVESFCPRCIYLEDGRIAVDGPTSTAISMYLAGASAAPEGRRGEFDLSAVPRPPGLRPVLRHLSIRDQDGHPTDVIRMGDGLSLVIDVEGLTVPLHFVRVRPVAETGSVVVNVNSR